MKFCISSLIAVVLWASLVDAAPTVSAGTPYTASPGVISESGSYTNAAGSNRVMLLAIACRDSSDTVADPTSVKYAGNAMTQVVTTGAYNASTLQVWLYQQINPASGANNWLVDWPDACNQSLIVPMTLLDTNQTTPYSNTNSATGTGSPSVACTSASGELVVDMTMLNDGGHTITVGAGQTQLSNDSVGGGNLLGGTSYEAGAASVTMSWTLSAGTDPSGIVCASFKPFVASTAVQNLLLMGVGN